MTAQNPCRETALMVFTLLEMKDLTPFDFWYAVNNTEIVLMPSSTLETFGTTILNYHLVSELMDCANQIRIREGRMQAHRPQIITPEAYAETLLEGFGQEASRYVEWLKEHEKDIRCVLQYGYRLRQESFSEHVVTDNIKAVTDQVKERVAASRDPFSAVVVGVDEPWDVCLIKLFHAVVIRSAAANIMDLEKRRAFENIGGVPRWLRSEIDEAFLAASRDPSLTSALAAKLKKYGLFDEYQDRFFALVKAARKKEHGQEQ